MNQIINMIMRQLMRRLVNKGVDVGISQASRLGKRKNAPAPMGEIDDYGNPVAPKGKPPGQQASRQARQSMKAMRRISKF